MSKIMNIGALDVRDVHEDVARQIKKIKNIGLLIENDRSQVLLKEVERINVGATLKLSSDQDVNLVTINGSLKMDREYLEGIINPVIMLVNGSLVLEKDIDSNLLNEKLYTIQVNGELTCPKKLSGTIQSKGIINGYLNSYSSDYAFFSGDTRLTNNFLKGIRPSSKLSFGKLLVLEPIDLKLLEDKISNIEILNKLIIMEEYEDEISRYIDNYYSLNKVIIPNVGNEIRHIDDDMTIDDTSIKKYNHIVLYVEGEVILNLNEAVDFGQYIELLICDKLICNEKTYEAIKGNIGEDVEVDIIQGKLLSNNGKMILAGMIEEEISIRNMGKLVLDEKLDYDSFAKNVASIVNYGVVEAPEEKMSLVKDKVEKNFGKIKSANENKVSEVETENVLYSNIGELKL